MVAFGFLPQNFGRWWEPTDGTLSFYECRFSGGNTQTRPRAKEFELFALTDCGIIVLSNDEFFTKIIRLSTSFGQVDIALHNSRAFVSTRPKKCPHGSGKVEF